jgi:hypothetical protein
VLDGGNALRIMNRPGFVASPSQKARPLKQVLALVQAAGWVQVEPLLSQNVASTWTS